MSTAPPPGSQTPRPAFFTVRSVMDDPQDLRAGWFFFVLLGALLTVLGVACLVYSVAASIITALMFGVFLIVAGCTYLVGAFFSRSWGGFFVVLLAGVLHLAAGVILIAHPAEALILYTLLLAVFFFVEGLFRIFAALSGRFHHWGIVLFSGVVTSLLGVLIWRQWPLSGLYVVGVFAGINLITSGLSFVSLGISARRLG